MNVGGKTHTSSLAQGDSVVFYYSSRTAVKNSVEFLYTETQSRTSVILEDLIRSAADRLVYLIGKHTYVAGKRSRLGHCAVSTPKWIPTFRKHYEPSKLQEVQATQHSIQFYYRRRIFTNEPAGQQDSPTCTPLFITAIMSVYLNSAELYLTTVISRNSDRSHMKL